MSKQLYILAGCNGAGKTTASKELIPEILDCQIFVNADEIAFELSPFQPESVAIQAGRIMLAQIQELLSDGENFTFETTLAAKSYTSTIKQAKELGYEITLIFMWLNTVDLAIERVASRVKEGGHHIPTDTIRRRYKAGLQNLFQIYLPNVDNFMIFDSTNSIPVPIAHKFIDESIIITNPLKWHQLKQSQQG
jgi:predicted ABC-type ATPase